MTETQIRQKVVNQAKSWLGCKESDGSHRKIIDLYNSHKPLARSYAVKYTDAWCATFVSATSIACGYTDIMPTECGCGKMIELYQKLGRWEENDAYKPEPGDVVFYDWDDNGVGDNKGASDHVGIVEKVVGTTITVIEGNCSNSVKRREIQVNGRYIRGYGLPAFEKKATKEDTGAKLSVEEIAKKVINGDYGNGVARKSKLEAEGYNYETVQAKVNEILRSGSTSTPSKKETYAIGDKVKVNGYIYAYGSGKGNKIKKNNETMYVVGLVDSKTYAFSIGVAAKKGGIRQGWTNKATLTHAD
jgi:hypothetical protein